MVKPWADGGANAIRSIHLIKYTIPVSCLCCRHDVQSHAAAAPHQPQRRRVTAAMCSPSTHSAQEPTTHSVLGRVDTVQGLAHVSADLENLSPMRIRQHLEAVVHRDHSEVPIPA